MITVIVRISALQIVAPDSRSQRELEKPQPRATGLTDEGLTIPTGRTDAEAEAPILWPPDSKSWLVGKDPNAGKDWGQEEAEDEIGLYHRFNGHQFEQTLGDGEGQGSLTCCSPWGHKESDTTEQLNNKALSLLLYFGYYKKCCNKGTYTFSILCFHFPWINNQEWNFWIIIFAGIFIHTYSLHQFTFSPAYEGFLFSTSWSTMFFF